VRRLRRRHSSSASRVPLTEQLQASQVEATVYLNGAKVARGWDEAVLDDPVNSVVWLTGKLNQFAVGGRLDHDRIVRAPISTFAR
jgi:2-keto-4-pentenoate hydratase